MAGDTVQQIKDRLSITDVVSQYVKLERSGTAMRARCPFHAEKTPSFFVSLERGTYHCFGCGVGGDIFTFVQQIEGLDFKGALKVLAEKAGVDLVYERGGREQKDERDRLFELLEAAAIFYASHLSAEAKQYLAERGLNEATIKAFRLGLAGDRWSDLADHLIQKKFTDKELLEAGIARPASGSPSSGRIVDKFRNRIIFPIADSAGRVVGFSGRSFGPRASPEAPKYLNSPETPLFHKSRILYGFDRAKQVMRKLHCAVLVEGQMDLLASYQAGWENTVAASGTAFTPEHAALIRRFTDNLVVALDADEAGIKAASKAARAALHGGLNVKVVQLPDGLDPADFIRTEGADAWRQAVKGSKDIIVFLLDVLEVHAKGSDGFRRSVEAIVLPFLSEVRSPIAREQYLRVIAGRLGVSERAVIEAFANVPVAPADGPGSASTAPAPSATRAAAAPANGHSREKQAFALLLWQRSLREPQIDLATFEQDMTEVIGEKVLAAMRALDKSEQEALRFEAEWLFGASTSLSREANTLLRFLAKDRAARELSQTAVALKKAENEHDEAEIERLISVHKLLTTKIAQLHDTV